MPKAESLVLPIYQRIAEEWPLLEQAGLEQGLRVACREGCAACCTYVVDGTAAEAVLIAQAIQLSSRKRRTTLIGDLAAWCKEWETMIRADGADETREEYQRVALAWQLHRYACPFLDVETYRCRVYSTRPLACRTHHACYLTGGETGTCCPSLEPPEGCFTQPTGAEHGHHSATWMLNPSLGKEYAAALIGDHLDAGVKPIIGVLPLLVWGYGAYQYGWKEPFKLPMIQRLSTASKDI